jgi:nitroreductase
MEHIMNLYEAIFVRKTTRKFDMNPMEQSKLDGILGFTESVPLLFPEINLEYKIITREEALQYFSGSIHVKAPYYFIVTSANKPGYLLNAGYLLQQVSLYLTAKGYGSCYIGMLKQKKGMEDSSKKYIMTLALGNGEHEVYRTSDKAKRLPVDDIAIFKSEVSKDIKNIIQAARLAPSSMNNQPWRLVVYHNRIHIFCKKNLFLSSVLNEIKLIDIGICLANIMVAAEELWVDMKPVKIDKMDNFSLKKNDYIISLKMF